MAGPVNVRTAIAQAVLAELVAEPGTPISASDIGGLVGLTAREAGAYLRELHDAGLAKSTPVSPASTRVLWEATDAGRAAPRELDGIVDELRHLEARREARAT
jgi:DNA-binding MarR family transcriptional regulator